MRLDMYVMIISTLVQDVNRGPRNVRDRYQKQALAPERKHVKFTVVIGIKQHQARNEHERLSREVKTHHEQG